MALRHAARRPRWPQGFAAHDRSVVSSVVSLVAMLGLVGLLGLLGCECENGAVRSAVPESTALEADSGPPDATAVPSPSVPDAHVLSRDAHVPLGDTAGDDPTTPPRIRPGDEGPCAERDADCTLSRAQTTLGSAHCTIADDLLHVKREICEVCGQATQLVDFSLAIMDCGGCNQVYRQGHSGGSASAQVDARGCRTQNEAAELTWTAADQRCVDVYATVSSGRPSPRRPMVHARDEVRICRCDRTTNTCIRCVDGACGTMP